MHCRRQLADFQKRHDSYRDEDVALLAISADGEEDAAKMGDRVEARYSLGWGVDAAGFAQKTGCFYEPEDGYVHACGFIVAPDGTIASAVYSAGAIGRYRADEALEQAKFYRGDNDDD